MRESRLGEKMELIMSLLDELHQISNHQHSLLANGDLDELAATFEQRQVLFARLQAVKQAVDQEIAERPSEPDQVVESYRRQYDSSLERFLLADQRVSLLLNHHLERIGFRLLQRLKAKDAAQNYKRIEHATSRIAQVFPGNARYTDIQK